MKPTSTSPQSPQPAEPPDSTDDEARPTAIGDFGQDDAFATESHPEGLQYGGRPRVPGEVYHGERKPHSRDKPGDHPEGHEGPPLSIGPSGSGGGSDGG